MSIPLGSDLTASVDVVSLPPPAVGPRHRDGRGVYNTPGRMKEGELLARAAYALAEADWTSPTSPAEALTYLTRIRQENLARDIMKAQGLLSRHTRRSGSRKAS